MNHSCDIPTTRLSKSKHWTFVESGKLFSYGTIAFISLTSSNYGTFPKKLENVLVLAKGN